MDPLSRGRMNEEQVFDIIRTNSDNSGAEDCEGDGSEFLNDHGPGMEPEHSSRANSQTSTECDDDDSQMSERPPPQSGKVY